MEVAAHRLARYSCLSRGACIVWPDFKLKRFESTIRQAVADARVSVWPRQKLKLQRHPIHNDEKENAATISVQPFDKREAASMNAFALKYGNQSITLAQSKQLIGVKLRQNKADDAAVQRTLPKSSWKSEGLLGGFRLVSICDCAVDADQALDQIRRDESVLVGTHVFELSEGRGIFVPTGELFVGFKLGNSV
jgi:hypothetical protein